MSLNDHIHSVYVGNIKNSRPVKLHRLGHTLKSIKTPDQQTINLNLEIRNCTDPSQKAKLKTQLHSYTPAVVCSKSRKYENIVSFSGLLILDFDKLPDENYAIDFKKYLFNEYPFIYSTWLSSSAKGVRAIVKIPIVESIDDYKAHFGAIEQHFMAYIGFDSAPKNCVLPLFQSYDPELLYRKEAETFLDKYYAPQPPPNPPVPIISDDKTTRRIVNIVSSAINKINDNGHPQLRGASFALGGYVGAGYIAYYDAISLIDSLIMSNSYLNIKPDVYKKTARTMIQKGQYQPLYL